MLKYTNYKNKKNYKFFYTPKSIDMVKFHNFQWNKFNAIQA